MSSLVLAAAMTVVSFSSEKIASEGPGVKMSSGCGSLWTSGLI